MKTADGFSGRSLRLFIVTLLFLAAGLGVIPAQGEGVAVATFYVH